MRLVIAAAFAAFITSAVAAPSPGVQRFTQDAQQFILIEAQAILATQCRLRSDAWLTMMSDGIETMLIQDGNENNVHGAQAFEIRRQIANLVQAYQPKPTATVCANLRHSSVMDRLDAVEHELTGGYH